MVAGLRAQLVHHAGIFLRLGGFQALLPRPEQRAGIGHRIVQPQAVKVVAEVVMVADVPLGLRLGVPLQPVPEPLVHANQPHAGKAVIDVPVVLVHEIHQRLKVGRAPPPFEIGIAEPQIAFADQPRETIRVVDVELGHRPRRLAFHAKAPPVGQDEVEPPAIDLLHRLESLREVARQVLLAGRVGQDHSGPPVRIHQG